MNCRFKHDCVNNPFECLKCKEKATYSDLYPCFADHKPVRKVRRFKIFFGNHLTVPADDILNEWVKNNPKVRIIEWQYSQARMGDHSICIEYEEEV